MRLSHDRIARNADRLDFWRVAMLTGYVQVREALMREPCEMVGGV